MYLLNEIKFNMFNHPVRHCFLVLSLNFFWYVIMTFTYNMLFKLVYLWQSIVIIIIMCIYWQVFSCRLLLFPVAHQLTLPLHCSLPTFEQQPQKRIIVQTSVAPKFLVTQQALRGPVFIYILLDKQTHKVFIFSFKVQAHSENVKLKCLFSISLPLFTPHSFKAKHNLSCGKFYVKKCTQKCFLFHTLWGCLMLASWFRTVFLKHECV